VVHETRYTIQSIVYGAVMIQRKGVIAKMLTGIHLNPASSFKSSSVISLSLK